MNTTLGIDIGTRIIKLIELSSEKGVHTLLSAGSMTTPKKNDTSSGSVDVESLAYVIRELIKETGAKSEEVNIALPESQVFTRVIEIPQLSHKELTSAIQIEAEQYIPLPLDQVNIDYTILDSADRSQNGNMQVLLVAAPKVLIERYMSILELANLVPVAAETEMIATGRAINKSISSIKNVLLVSLGAQTTDISIFHNGIITFARSVSAGGDALSRSLVQTLDFTLVQAEEYKKTYGLQKSVLEGKLAVAMKPVMNTIIGEIKRAIAYFEERHTGERIETIILNGGTAKLPGIVTFMTESLAIETQLANPWVGIQKDIRFSVLDQEGPVFSVAVGLALRA